MFFVVMPTVKNVSSRSLPYVRRGHAPAVKTSLTNVVFLAKLRDEAIYVSVMDYVPLRGVEYPLPVPNVIRHTVTIHAMFDVISREPEIGQNDVPFILRPRSDSASRCCRRPAPCRC